VARKLKHFWLGDKPTRDIVGEAVRAALTAVVVYVLLAWWGQSDAVTFAEAFGVGLFMRGLRP
jgi:hypothetical protein